MFESVAAVMKYELSVAGATAPLLPSPGSKYLPTTILPIGTPYEAISDTDVPGNTAQSEDD
jgi:hypothetical protein